MEVNVTPPQTRAEVLQIVHQMKKKDFVYFYATYDGVGILADTYPEIQVTDFGIEPIPVSEHGRTKDLFTVTLTDTSGSRDLEEIVGQVGEELDRLTIGIVGRETWRLGVFAQTETGGVGLLAVLSDDDSETLINIMEEDTEIGIRYLPHGPTSHVVYNDQSHTNLLGNEIDFEYLVNNLVNSSIEWVPGE